MDLLVFEREKESVRVLVCVSVYVFHMSTCTHTVVYLCTCLWTLTHTYLFLENSYYYLLDFYFNSEKDFIFKVILPKDKLDFRVTETSDLCRALGDSGRTWHSVSFVSFGSFQFCGSVGSLTPNSKSQFVFLLSCLLLLAFNYCFPLMPVFHLN